MITSTRNPRVKWVRKLQAQRSARHQEGVFIMEGLRWAGEMLKAGHPGKLVLYTGPLDAQCSQVVLQLAQGGAEVQPVSDEVMAACSDTHTPQGILIVATMPDPSPPDRPNLVLVLDGLSDPGNLGTILRTALAARVEALYLTPGSVDAYNPKVVRAAVGAHLRLPIRIAEAEGLGALLAGLRVWSAVARQGHAYDQVDWTAPSALVIGGETQGIDPAIMQLATGRCHIPTGPASESLNAAVACAVILFEIQRQRGQS